MYTLREPLLESLSPPQNPDEARITTSATQTTKDTFFYVARETVDSMTLPILIVLSLQTYAPLWMAEGSCAVPGEGYGHDRKLMMFLGVFLFDIFGFRNVPAAAWEDSNASVVEPGFLRKLLAMKRSDWTKVRLTFTAHRVVSTWRLGQDYTLPSGAIITAMIVASYPIMRFIWERILATLKNTQFPEDHKKANYLKNTIENFTQKRYVALMGKMIDVLFDAIGQGIRSASAFHLLTDTVVNDFVYGESDDDTPYQQTINIFALTMVFMGIVVGIVANLLSKFAKSRLKDSQKHVQAFEQAMAIFVACMVTLMGVAVCGSIQLLAADYYREHGLGLASMSAVFGVSAGAIAYSGTLDKPKQEMMRQRVTDMLQRATAPTPEEGTLKPWLRWGGEKFTQYVKWLHNPTATIPPESAMPLAHIVATK